MGKDTIRRSPLQIVVDAEDDLTQAHLAGKYITKLREDIQEIVNACSDDAIKIMTIRGLLTKGNIEQRSAAQHTEENGDTKDDIFS
jgi:hypothetical protein